MMSSEDVAARAVATQKAFSAFEWDWNRTFWRKVIGSLQLRPVSEVPNRSTHLLNDRYVHAYFSSDVLEFVIAEIDVYEPPERLLAADFDNMSDAFYEKYQAALSALSQALGKPKFEDGAAAEG